MWHLLAGVARRRTGSAILGAALTCATASACTPDRLTVPQTSSPEAFDGGTDTHTEDGATAARDGPISRRTGGADAGSTFPCGPSGNLLCSCGSAYYFPAPTNDAGQAETFATTPDATTDNYTTTADFDALAVGRWRRTAGEGQLSCEQFGIDFTSDHRMIPLVIANDGSVQQVVNKSISFGLSFADANITPAAFTDDGGLYANMPRFFDADEVMLLNYAPWPADYVRVR